MTDVEQLVWTSMRVNGQHDSQIHRDAAQFRYAGVQQALRPSSALLDLNFRRYVRKVLHHGSRI